MSKKAIYTIGIMDENKISEVNAIIAQYADITMTSSSHMYFDKQPINVNQVVQDVTFFHIDAEDDATTNEKLGKLIERLNELHTDYLIRDEETEKLIVTIDFSGYIIAKFDKVKFIDSETYEKIDEIKCMKTDIGYCKGFKPKFRPLGGISSNEIFVNPEIIYLVSDSDENLKKLKDIISEMLLEIEPDFEFEFGRLAPDEF